jgi:hypothetical protein
MAAKSVKTTNEPRINADTTIHAQRDREILMIALLQEIRDLLKAKQ